MIRTLTRILNLKNIFRFGIFGIGAALLCALSSLSSEISAAEPTDQEISNSKPVIYRLKPERKDGRGYKLIYFCLLKDTFFIVSIKNICRLILPAVRLISQNPAQRRYTNENEINDNQHLDGSMHFCI
jgi:hypothetical protein